MLKQYLLETPNPPLPKVSILIAARDEARNIVRCLQAIDSQNYPRQKLQILIGDDDSTDGTAALVQGFIKGKPHFRLLPIRTQLAGLQGKTNVLAQLAHEADGAFLLITDADVCLPATWVAAMLAQFGPHTGVVTGVTTVGGQDLFARMQALDWVVNIYAAHRFSERGIPITAIGNNMAVTREAYEATGGYEKVGFSLTEDFALFMEIVRRGYGFRNLFQADVLAVSQPVDTWRQLFRQRKRWMTGAFQLQWFIVLGLVLQAFYVPVMLMVMFFNWKISLSIIVLKWLCHMVFVRFVFNKIRQRTSFIELLVFEWYSEFMNFLYLMHYCFSAKTHWKGRQY